MAGSDQGITLPKNALKFVELGHSFAEYDPVLKNPQVYVETPAFLAAMQRLRSKCVFVGRRGTGKTAITLQYATKKPHCLPLFPHVLTTPQLPFRLADLIDTRQRPFHSLTLAYKHALYQQVLIHWIRARCVRPYELSADLNKEIPPSDEEDFDSCFLGVLGDLATALPNEKHWLRFLKRPTRLLRALEGLPAAKTDKATVLIDRIDDDWDGSDTAVVSLMALLHASVQITAETELLRPLVFVRENIFERVRSLDNEFGRLETWIVSLDWTPHLLLEMIERRLVARFNTKPPLGGAIWNHFFEPAGGEPSYNLVFKTCQHRPRDILTYCEYAVEGAKANGHEQVKVEDLLSAKLRFSQSRLKDLGDEYSENYPQIQLVLQRFFGLGTRYSLAGMRDFVKALLTDSVVKAACGQWLFQHTSPEHFMTLLYNIGFVGLTSGTDVRYRGSGARGETTPTIEPSTHAVVHPTFADALQLRDVVISSLDPEMLRVGGVLLELPGALTLEEYQRRLNELSEELKTLPEGPENANKYESLVGDLLQLCFGHVLSNVKPRVRDFEGRVVRDWIASNVAAGGFWEMVRLKYGATQVVWECKNFADLGPDAFHQIAYYLNDTIGKFGVICFRGDIKKHYYGHIKRIAIDKNAMTLLVTDRDLQVFLRQARNGKIKDSHIQDIFDTTVREVS